MRSEHEHKLQSIGCFLLNTHRVNAETLACERQLKRVQDKFSSPFDKHITNKDLTNNVIINFHKVLAAMSDLRPRLFDLNQQIDKQNNDLFKIQTTLREYIARAASITTTTTSVKRNSSTGKPLTTPCNRSTPVTK
eukprot:gene16340-17977_t